MSTVLAILKEIAQAPGLLKELYGDLAKPGVSQVGKALGSVLGLGNTILWPITLMNEKANIALKRNLEKYREQIKEVPEDELTEVPPEIGVPITEKLSYVTNEELSNLYVNLLAKASTFKTAESAHPSFVNIINNLSPDEALLLEQFRDTDALPYVEARLVKKDNRNQWLTVAELLTDLRVDKLAFPDNLISYLSNFEGLGLIKIRKDIFIVNDALYDPIEKRNLPLFDLIQYSKETHEPELKRRKIEITSFGQLFIKACLSSLKDQIQQEN
ncbi:MAG: hypothetical protein A2054_01330 [Deltaproteobacteria bacterium GWA2_55_10]|nr:MAG: hypothetical protein A2054_01330 [Deltaproteobacteria bacterium GWA2_55_10]